MEGIETKTFGYRSTLYSSKTLEKLAFTIDKIPVENEMFLIGHSLGGLVAKNYLQKYEPNKKITLITLGTPHNGND